MFTSPHLLKTTRPWVETMKPMTSYIALANGASSGKDAATKALNAIWSWLRCVIINYGVAAQVGEASLLGVWR